MRPKIVNFRNLKEKKEKKPGLLIQSTKKLLLIPNVSHNTHVKVVFQSKQQVYITAEASVRHRSYTAIQLIEQFTAGHKSACPAVLLV